MKRMFLSAERRSTPLIAERILWLGALLFLGFASVTLIRGSEAHQEALRAYPAAINNELPAKLNSVSGAAEGADIERRLVI